MRWNDKKGFQPISKSETKGGTPISVRQKGPRVGFYVVMILMSLIVIIGAQYIDYHYLVPWLMIGAWSSIAASETDVNSPLNQTLMDKIRGNLDWIYARVRDTPTDANWITQSHIGTSAVGQDELKTTTVEELENNSTNFKEITDGTNIGQYGFWPVFKHSGSGDAGMYLRLAHVSPSLVTGTTHASISTSYLPYVFHGITGAKNFYARWRYVQASRDFPLVLIKRNKITGHIYTMSFRPEGYLERIPYIESEYHDGAEEKDIDLLCMQLKHDKKLCEYLIKDYYKVGFFVELIQLLLLSEELIIKDTTIDPILLEKTSKTDDYKALGLQDPDISPILYNEKIKLVNWDFKLKDIRD